MRNPANVLNSLSAHSAQLDYKFKRLYRILLNPLMYRSFIQTVFTDGSQKYVLCSRKSAMAQSTVRNVSRLIASLRKESYQPQSLDEPRGQQINAHAGAQSLPFGVDQVLEQLVCQVLEALYEGSFEHSADGYRPHRSCHSALLQVQRSFSGVCWLIVADPGNFVGKIDHRQLLRLLRARIQDERFVRLIQKFLRAGYLNHWTFGQTYSGSPKGTMLGSMLLNIYFDQLDKFMHSDPEHWVMMQGKSAQEQEAFYASQCTQTGSDALAVPGLGKVSRAAQVPVYIRYGDSMLIGLQGRFCDAKGLLEQLESFLRVHLNVPVSPETFRIVSAQKTFRFLSYDLSLHKGEFRKGANRSLADRYVPTRMLMRIPKHAIRNRLLAAQILEIKRHRAKTCWKARAANFLICRADQEILRRYQAELQGFDQYYALAGNAATMGNLRHMLLGSMYKTFAAKYRTTVRRICQKYYLHGRFSIGGSKEAADCEVFCAGLLGQRSQVPEACCDLLPPNGLPQAGWKKNAKLLRRKQ